MPLALARDGHCYKLGKTSTHNGKTLNEDTELNTYNHLKRQIFLVIRTTGVPLK